MRQNFTVDDKSPMIKYTSAWRPGNTQDPFWLSYAGGGTFQVSEALDDTASFTFNGTAVYVLGAKRDNHGPYSVSLDGQDEELFDGFANPYVFQTALDSRTGLTSGQHTVSITNKRTSEQLRFLDVDSIIWEAEIDDQASIAAIVDDSDSGIEYLPSPSSWRRNSCTDLTSHVNNTCHATTEGSASMQVSFKGDAIFVYGAVGPSQGTYSVQIDDQPIQVHSANANLYNPQQMLYFATGLGMGNHKLKVTNSPSVGGQNSLIVDYMQIYTSDRQPLQLQASTPAARHGMQPGAIAGLVIGLLVLFALLAGAGVFFWRRRRRGPKPTFSLDSPSDDHEAGHHTHAHAHMPTYPVHVDMLQSDYYAASLPPRSEYGVSQPDLSDPYARVFAAVNMAHARPPTNYNVVQPARSHMSHTATSVPDNVTVSGTDSESTAASSTTGTSRSEKAAMIAALGPPPPVPNIPLPPVPGEDRSIAPPPYYPKRI